MCIRDRSTGNLPTASMGCTLLGMLLGAVLLIQVPGSVGGCVDGGNGGCSPPIGAKWDRWDMAGSTYTYCFTDCVMDWLINNTAPLNLPKFGGVVGVDHYWTKQGMPCVDGHPREFAMQDELTLRWKSHFPTLRFLQYRILSAVPYDMVVQDKILADHDAVIRWRHLPGSVHQPGNSSVCYNYISACFNDPHRINDPAHHCSFQIRAAAYNWSNPSLAKWYIDSVIAPTLVHADGIWLDGIGPDNGAYMCSGVCCGYGASNSPLVQTEIDAHCDAQFEATTAVQKFVISRQGWEAQACFDYLSGTELPNADDDAASCGGKLEKWSAFGADHSNYNFVVAYGCRTGGRQSYNDTTVEATVAAFLLIRGQHWLFSIGPSDSKGGLAPATARVLLSDYGRPKGLMSKVVGKTSLYQRVFEKATVVLDCADFSSSFIEHDHA
eukprot:TRINITY_DN29992_c0_g1_i2.p1 TRINITY_DN29992_c0_g1~~TRINITY_DN29992_c0_g1_i2.p1  ORF type:complete len:438 (-),score=93.92 TRINITY_DN29992_c0_g1_i2:314-1627(-)